MIRLFFATIIVILCALSSNAQELKFFGDPEFVSSSYDVDEGDSVYTYKFKFILTDKNGVIPIENIDTNDFELFYLNISPPPPPPPSDQFDDKDINEGCYNKMLEYYHSYGFPKQKYFSNAGIIINDIKIENKNYFLYFNKMKRRYKQGVLQVFFKFNENLYLKYTNKAD